MFLFLALSGPVSPDAGATQLPLRSEPDDAACDPRLGPRFTPRLLNVTVNETFLNLDIVALQRPCGALLARQGDLEAMRIITAGKPAVEINGEKYLNLNAFPGLTYELRPEEQRLLIEGKPRIFYPTILNFEHIQTEDAKYPAPGGFLNYGMFASGSNSGADPSYLGLVGLGVFGKPGVLTSDWQYSRSTGVNKTYRTATTFTHDDQPRMTTLRVGDVYTLGGAFGGGAAIGGVQYGTNFALRPGLITTPVQMMAAATSRTALLDLQRLEAGSPQQDARSAYFFGLNAAPYGPVQLVNVPTYDNGEYRLLLRDYQGRITRVTQEFFFNQGLLRSGLTQYSAEGGFLRRAGFGDHYGGGFASGTLRRGESPSFTDEFHAEVSTGGFTAGATGLWSVPHWGVGSLTLAGSETRLGGAGAFVAAGLENRYEAYAYAARVDCRSSGFQFPTDLTAAGGMACREFASLSGRLPWHDYASLSVADSQQRNTPGFNSVQLSYSRSLFAGSQLQLFAARSDSGRAVTYSAGLTFSYSFGAWGTAEPGDIFDPARTNLIVQANQTSHSNSSAFGQISTNTRGRDNTFGAQAGTALDGRDVQTLSGNWLGNRALGSAHWSNNEGGKSYGVGASSALVFMDGGVFAARPLSSSFALVRLGPESPAVHVNDFRTNGDGDIVVPSLQPYVENSVVLDPSDLPVNARVRELKYRVRPRFRSGVVLRPSIQQPRDALLTVQLVNSEGERVPLPPGGYATVAGEPDPFPVGDEGLLYVSGVGKAGEVTVHYREQQCQLRLKLPAHPPADSTPELGTFLCKGVMP